VDFAMRSGHGKDTPSAAHTAETSGGRAPIVTCVTSEEARLVGARELRVRLGIACRQRVYKLAGRRDFPAPAAVLAQGKVWLLSEVEEWIETHRGRAPFSPPRQDAVGGVGSTPPLDGGR